MGEQITSEELRAVKARNLAQYGRDVCEYSPTAERACYETEVHAKATWIVGAKGQWRLCDSCAALPAFKRFRRRKRIRYSSVSVGAAAK